VAATGTECQVCKQHEPLLFPIFEAGLVWKRRRGAPPSLGMMMMMMMMMMMVMIIVFTPTLFPLAA